MGFIKKAKKKVKKAKEKVKKILRKTKKEAKRAEKNAGKVIHKIGKEIGRVAKDLSDGEYGKIEGGEFRYDVDTSGPEWRVTFLQFSKVRHHTSREYAPYIDNSYNANDIAIVKPGQWLEGYVNSTWSLLIDADHR